MPYIYGGYRAMGVYPDYEQPCTVGAVEFGGFHGRGRC